METVTRRSLPVLKAAGQITADEVDEEARIPYSCPDNALSSTNKESLVDIS
jgi:hypothetical protein